jgi:hypothetical protein
MHEAAATSHVLAEGLCDVVECGADARVVARAARHHDHVVAIADGAHPHDLTIAQHARGRVPALTRERRQERRETRTQNVERVGVDVAILNERGHALALFITENDGAHSWMVRSEATED